MSSSLGGYTGLRGPTGKQGNKIPSGYKQGQLQNFTPEQMNLFQQMFSQVSPDSYLSKLAGGDQGAFDQLEAPALRQFNELQGNLASRFSAGGGGRGAMSSRHSSGFQNAATSAASNFAQELQSQRQALQRQAVMDLMGISQSLLSQRPYEQFLLPKQKSKSSGWGSAIGAGIGGVGGFLAGGPAGALTGAQLGFGVGSAF